MLAVFKVAIQMSYFLLLSFIRNEIIHGTRKVGEISKKLQESRLKYYGQEYVGKRVMVMEVPGENYFP